MSEESTPDLFDIDRTDPWLITLSTHRLDSARGRKAPKGVNYDCGIEQNPSHSRSAGPAGIGLSLSAHPRRGIFVPGMPRGGDGSQRRFDLVPSILVVEGAAYQGSDESTSVTLSGTSV